MLLRITMNKLIFDLYTLVKKSIFQLFINIISQKLENYQNFNYPKKSKI